MLIHLQRTILSWKLTQNVRILEFLHFIVSVKLNIPVIHALHIWEVLSLSYDIISYIISYHISYHIIYHIISYN